MYQIKLSPYAKTFYTEWLLEPDSSRYNMLSADQTLHGPLDIQRLRQALRRYVAEHVLLNSHIQAENGEPYWVKNDYIGELEYSDGPIDKAGLLSYVARPFDLYLGPLYRFKLIRITEKVHRLIIVLHHLVMDGMSLNSGLFAAVSNYYNDEYYTSPYSIEQQLTLITNLEQSLSAKLEQNRARHKAFWQQQLADVENIDLRFLKLDTAYQQHTITETINTIGEIRFDFGMAELAKLNQIKRKYTVTPYRYGQCIFAMLLNRYTGQERFAIAYPLAIKEGSDFIYGAQVNTNLISYRFSQTATIKDLFKQNEAFFKLIVRDDVKHGYYPITDILQNNNKHLLDVYFAQAYFRDKPLEFIEITEAEAAVELTIDSVAKDTLVFELEPVDNKLAFRVRYDKRFIYESLVHNFINSYKKLFLRVLDDLISENDSKPLSNYSLLDSKQYQQIVYEFNQTHRDYPQNKTIHELFEEQVVKTPHNIAVVYEDIRLTYQELNSRANQLAHYLRREYEIQPDDLIVLCLDRNEQTLIAILAVLKAGGAYVPVDPSYPEDRISYILIDTQAKVVLTNNNYQAKLKSIAKNILVIDAVQLQQELSKEKIVNLQISVSSNHLAYVIYTSGTTGKPKGVMIEQKSILRLVKRTNYIEITPNDRISQGSNIAFDASTFEIWGALLNGASLVIFDKEDLLNPIVFKKQLLKENITILFLTSALFDKLANSTPEAFYKLSYLLVGGDIVNPCSIRNLQRNSLAYTEHLNIYGPTENTTFSTAYRITKLANSISAIPIGKPISNTNVYVLGRDFSLLPIGAIGELFIGGEGLARGYLNQPDLTKEKFIANPFQTAEEKLQNQNGRLYKTGDLVRMLPDGNLEYLGRNDLQVKIRGYRIELAEIEHTLVNYHGIQQAVVLARNAMGQVVTDKYLAAYYVAEQPLDSSKIRGYLATQLPDYMWPAVLVHLDKLPLTINGKLDLKALPEPIFASHIEYMPPGNEQERLTCLAFAKILNIKKIGIYDDFFNLGGDSLKAIKLTTTLQAHFDIKVADIFQWRTPQRIAAQAHFGSDFLRQKLKQVKRFYQAKDYKNHGLNKSAQVKLDRYLSSISQLQIDAKLQKPIVNVLLTGATGYLGCNLLYQLLMTTSYNVFLPIRASTQAEAIKRLNRKFQFYFNQSVIEYHGSRVFIIQADLEKVDLGLAPPTYQMLQAKIDSIIHNAALTKHYGEYDKFYAANVQATRNLLELAKLTRLRDFHYISTVSVLNTESTLEQDNYLYTEDDAPQHLTESQNVYNQTKLQGEQLVVKYREYGLTSNIYRVGNLAFMAQNYRAQENLADNAFYNWLNCLLTIKGVAQAFNKVQLSQTDLTAQAIVKLFDKSRLTNAIYHVFNPYLFDLANFFTNSIIFGVETLSLSRFIDRIIEYLEQPAYQELMNKFLLRQGWLEESNMEKVMAMQVLQTRTQYVLKQLQFSWQPIDESVFAQYLQAIFKNRLNDHKIGERLIPSVVE